MGKKKSIYPQDFLNYIQSVTNKRAKILIDHILQYGFITTEDLENYGYNHPPRAARDVREAGIPLETFKVKSKTGKSIAAYRFGDSTELQINKVSGRKTFSKDFKKKLFEFCEGTCAICNGKFAERYLQIDHRTPYEISGDSAKTINTKDFMLLCASCNRAKSWSCEHCDNWQNDKDATLCSLCYWGNPRKYNHIALKKVRRLDLQWEGEEVKNYDKIKTIADSKNVEMPSFVKQIIEDKLSSNL
ncbi:MAG: HNH endonuclease [Bacteroidales bacterium]|jgi:5-methylcytosine-specific restriction endonuclease McrA|nr:HNH endonuclease [Bacteroidales bacterium]